MNRLSTRLRLAPLGSIEDRPHWAQALASLSRPRSTCRVSHRPDGRLGSCHHHGPSSPGPRRWGWRYVSETLFGQEKNRPTSPGIPPG
jgi:hypothetical protein